MTRLLYAFGATFLIQLSGMFTGIVAARLLGAAGRGSLAELTSWAIGLAALGSLSVNEAVVYLAAKSPDRADQGKVLSTALFVAAVTSILTLLLAAYSIPWLSIHGQSGAGTAILLGLALIPVTQFSFILAAFFQSLGSTRLWTLIRLCPAVIGASFAALFLATSLGRSVEYFLLAALTGSLITLLLCGAFVWRHGATLSRPDAANAKKLLSFAVRSHPASIGGQRENLDRLLVSMFVPVASLGHYAVAATLPAMLMAVASTSDMVLFPSLALESDPKRSRLLFMRATRLAICLLALAAITIALASIVLIPVLFGEEYRPAVALAPVMSATYFLVAARFVIGSGYKAFGQPFRHSRGDLLAFGVSAVAIPLGAMTWGILGAAVAALLAQAAAFALALWGFKTGTGATLRQLFSFEAADLDFLKSRYADVRNRRRVGK